MKFSTYLRLVLIGVVSLVLFTAPTSGQSGKVKPPSSSEVDQTTPVTAQSEKNNPPAATKEKLSEEQLQNLRRHRESEEEAADLTYLRNYFEEYRLGPEDVIKVEVFGQQTQIYSEPPFTIPPDGKINYKLIGSINVRGRTVEDVQNEIAEKLNEYIIDPKVTVQLVQSHSIKYVIDGDVSKPGIYEMTRRMTVREVIANSGGILPTGDKTKVQIVRNLPNGQTMLVVNFKDLEQGKGIDEFIAPGDMIFVPGNKFKTITKWMSVVQTVTWLPMIMGGRRF